MSSELLVRTVVVVAIVGLALALALVARRFHRRPLGELDLRGIDGRIVLFADPACASCDRVRAMLRGEGVDFVEVSYEQGSPRWERTGVQEVPLLVVRRGDGAPAAQIAGIPGIRRLRRAVRRE